MKCLIFSTNYLPHIGGAELAVKEVTDRIDAYTFHLITAQLDASRPKRETIGNVEVHRIGFGSRLDVFLLAAFGWVKGLLLHRQLNFQTAWSLMASQGSIAASFFSIFSRTPLLLTLQEGNDEEHLTRYVGGSNFLYKLLIQPWHHLVFKTADHITAISGYLQERAERVSPQTPTSLIPNGVDIKAFSREVPAETIHTIRQKYSKGGRLIITTSRLVKKNAVGDLIQSLTHLPDEYNLLVLGDGPLRDELENQVKELGLEDQVFMPGSVDFSEIPQYLVAADIFARPSLSEGMGNSFLEAMAVGLPVVATPVGGIVDFLEYEKTGLFAEVENPEDIATQMKRFMEDDALHERVTSEAKDMVLSEYSWDIIATDYKAVLSNLAKK